MAILALLLVLSRAYPRHVDIGLVIGASWLATVLLAPSAGYMVHVDTDYTRFVYFLPLPVAFVALLFAERASARLIFPIPSGPAPSRPGSFPSNLSMTAVTRPRPRPRAIAVGLLTVGVALGLLFSYVSIPSVQAAEQSGTGAAHDQNTLAALNWLSANQTSGNVLTTQSVARWVEGLTARTAYTPGPTWLLFNSFQVNNAELSLWALTSMDSLTNGQAVMSFSGFSPSGNLDESPLYSVYVDGVAFPVLALNPTSMVVNATLPGGLPRSYSLFNPTGPSPSFKVSSSSVSAEVLYPITSEAQWVANVTETTGLGAGSAA